MSSPFIDPNTGGMNPGPQPSGAVPPGGQLLTPTGGGAAPPSMTLGQANGAAGTPDYMQQYMQNLQMLRSTAPYGHMDPPGIIRNILSFGGAGQDYDATRMYNARLDMQTANMAREMVASQATANALSGRQNMQNLQFGLQLQKYFHELNQDE